MHRHSSRLRMMKLSAPRLLLHVEGGVVLIAACIVYAQLGASWWRFAALFLAPDLSMLGYMANAMVGATLYNLVHTYAAPFILFLGAYITHAPGLFAICAIWLAHIGFDRLLGYGLKYPTTFKDTHIGRL
jgi:hypothetical protein